MELERKVFRIPEMKMDSADGPGTFEGYGSTFGNVDEGGDVILKGAFADALPDFLERGFVPVSHDWMGLPIATIADVKETDEGLWFSAEFHSTASAQEARTIMRERSERGKFVGLSIGYLPDYDNGVEYRDDGVRVLKKIKELAEISFVTVPMNRQAGVTAVKTGLEATPFQEHADRVAADVSLLAQRSRERIEYRARDGRSLTNGERERLTQVSDSLKSVVADLDAVLETKTDTNKGRLLHLQMQRHLRAVDATFLGVVD